MSSSEVAQKPAVTPATATSPSNLKLEANRANAKKSTGPKTALGKSRSRMNALKHGLFVCPTLPTVRTYNDKKCHKDLIEGLLKFFAPENIVEELLVQQIADCHWKLSQIQRIDSWTMDFTLADVEQEYDPRRSVFCDGHVMDCEELLAFRERRRKDYEKMRYLCEGVSPLVSVYSSRYERKLYKALAELERLQRERMSRAALLEGKSEI